MLEIVPDIAQGTHGNRNIFADIRNVPTRPHTVLGMFLLAFSVLWMSLLNFFKVKSLDLEAVPVFVGDKWMEGAFFRAVQKLWPNRCAALFLWPHGALWICIDNAMLFDILWSCGSFDQAVPNFFSFFWVKNLLLKILKNYLNKFVSHTIMCPIDIWKLLCAL